jgi:hypothetical protein
MPPGGSAAPPHVVDAVQKLQPVHHADREKMWLSQRHLVTQALLSVLQTANDTLAMVPFASLVLNGAIRAIRTFEVLYPLFERVHELVLISLPTGCLEERSSRKACRSAAQGGGFHPATALRRHPTNSRLYERRSPSYRDPGLRLVSSLWPSPPRLGALNSDASDLEDCVSDWEKLTQASSFRKFLLADKALDALARMDQRLSGAIERMMVSIVYLY